MGNTDHGELDRTLQRLAHPATPITPLIEDELASLTITTMRESRPIAQRRVWRLSLTAGVSLAAVIGVGAAAAAAGLLWAPWAQTPDGSFTYKLPSGIACEERVGNLHAENPEVQQAVQEIFSSRDVVADSDVAAWNERLLAEDSALAYAEATVRDSSLPGYSTTADVIYGMAVSRAVMETVDQELVQRGFDTSDERNMISIQGQTLCGEDIP